MCKQANNTRFYMNYFVFFVMNESINAKFNKMPNEKKWDARLRAIARIIVEQSIVRVCVCWNEEEKLHWKTSWNHFDDHCFCFVFSFHFISYHSFHRPKRQLPHPLPLSHSYLTFSWLQFKCCSCELFLLLFSPLFSCSFVFRLIFFHSLCCRLLCF